jgi:Leucine-rich repeat (LRR) protein
MIFSVKHHPSQNNIAICNKSNVSIASINVNNLSLVSTVRIFTSTISESEFTTVSTPTPDRNVTIECKKEYYNYWNDYICDVYEIAIRNDSIVTIPESNNNQYAINFTTIHIHGTEVFKIPPKLFAIFKNVKKIVANNVKMQIIENDTFHDAVNMEKLYLSHNLMKSLMGQIFSTLKKLRILELNGNEIENIHHDSFYGLENLERLYLNENKIKRLSPTVFNALQKLVFLTLDSNQIEEIEIDLFSQNRLLKSLGLSSNKIKDISKDVFLNFENLTDLSMSDNELMKLDLNGTHVQTLVIRNNNELKQLKLSSYPKMIVAFQSPIERIEIVDVKEFHRYPNWNGYWFNRNIIFIFYVRKTLATLDNIESYDGLIRHHIFLPESDYLSEDGTQFVAVQYLRKDT